ncbi:MAG: YceI family protein [Ignavibacteriae bacterium]|nr:YceI family protein [Ignavibacteriota bacterium]
MKQILIYIFLYFIFAGILVSQKNSESYKLLTDKSTIEWEGKKVLGSHIGNVKFESGFLNVKNNLITGGEFVIDMKSITNTDIEDKEYKDKLITHLKSDDFFNVSKYTKALFKITKVEQFKDDENSNINFKIFGDMTIKGIKNPISFPVIIRFEDKGIFARAKFSIDRTKWKIKYKSASIFSDLGDKFIYDDIWFKMDLFFSK